MKTIPKIEDIDPYKIRSIDYIKTGTIFDTVFHTKGIPYGKIIEIIGNEDGYKTYLTLSLLSHMQKQNKDLFILYIDSDCKIIENNIISNGIDISRFILIQSNVYNIIINTIAELTKADLKLIIVIDSLSTIQWGDKIAISINSFMNILTNCIYNSKSSIIVLNQVRMINKQKRAFCGNILSKYCTYRVVIKNNKNKELLLAITKNKYSNQYKEFKYCL